MAALGTALGARSGKPSLFAWPPSEEAVDRNGVLGLTSLAASCAACVYFTLRMKEESHTPAILKVKTRTDVRKERLGSSLLVKCEDTEQEKKGGAQEIISKDEKEGEKAEDLEWREAELEIRKPKLLQLISLADENLESGGKCHVRFKELLEACVDVRALDITCPELARGFHLAARVLMKELIEATKLTKEGKSALHRTGEDVADLIGRYSVLHAMCRGLSGSSKEHRAEMWTQMNALWWQSWRSQLMLWRMRIPDVAKACSIVLMAKRYIPLLFLASGLKVASNAMSALTTLFKAEAIETLRVKGFKWEDLTKNIWAALLVSGIKCCLTMTGDRLNTVAMMRLHHKLRTEVYSSMLKQDMEWYRLGQQDQRDIHGLFGEIFALPHLASLFVNATLRTLETSSSLAFTGSLIRQRSTGLLVVIIGSKFFLSTARTLLNIASKVGSGMVTRTMTKVEQNWAEPLMPENITTVRACAAEGKVLQNWNMFWRMEHETVSMRELVPKVIELLHGLVQVIGSRIEIGTAGNLIQENKIPYVADVQSLILLANEQGQSMYEAAWAILSIKEAIPKLARTYELVHSEPSIGLEGGIVPANPRAKGKIEFVEVSFAYPGTDEVVRDVSFVVPERSTCGITGSSGAGKSTILLLIQRLYDAQEGQILLDGVDIKTLNPLWLRQQISVVSQRPRIFHNSLLKNLTYGCEMEPTAEEVEAACKTARLQELIFQNPVRFPLGVHTRVSNETLSGGELQRLAIARALLKDSPILILDEATSALDSASQSLVKEGLNNLMEGRTVITVAHRLETIKDADAILCMEDGEVRERGTHQELVKAGGFYSRLYREQIESTVSNWTFGLDITDPIDPKQEGGDPAVPNSTD